MPFVDFMATGDVTFYKSIGFNAWNSVHLPIVYKLKSDKWPVNTVDTARTVTSFSNSNGYTQVTLSGDIKASGSADALEQVEISGTVSLDGVYKILSWSSDINFVIDLSYSSSNVFTGGTVQYYYGNYHARIKVYAGIVSSQYWGPYKPIELVAEIQQQPDPDGIVTVNINEFVKKKIKIIENNLLLDTLPNNVDAYCFFYIDYAESYDDANQYGTNDLNVSEFVGPYSSDAGNSIVAINAMLPFKSRGSGVLDNYIAAPGFTDTPQQKFLTGFTSPVLSPGFYFDVSFIINNTTTRVIQRNVYDANDVLLGTFTDTVTNMGIGVYRHPVVQSSFGEAYITLQIFSSSIYEFNAESEVLRIDVDTNCTPQDFYVTWLNFLGGYDYWNFKAETVYSTQVTSSRTQTKNIFPAWPNSYGETADSIEKQTSKTTRDKIKLHSAYVDAEQMDGLALIVESPLVQQLTNVYDRRTIIVENSAFPKKTDNQQLLMAIIDARYTDDNPSQSL